jgi:uncharacterized protein/uncharacterized tellurite resistance protein B-like protein
MGATKFVLIWVAALLWSFPVSSGAASFNCANAISSNELLICGDPKLSIMDDDLAVLYRAAKAVAPDAAAFKKKNAHERSRREKNCADRECLVEWYKHRSAQLATVLNHAQIAEAPIRSSPPQVKAEKPVVVAPSPVDNSSDFSTFVLIVGGAVGFFLLIEKVGEKRKLRAKSAKQNGSVPPLTLTSTSTSTAQRSTGSGVDINLVISDRARRSQSTVSEAAAKSGKRMPTVWVRPGQSVVVTGVTLPGGMLYVGSTLVAPDGGVEPAQIDPTLTVDSQPADPAERLFGYWPRYESISPTARRAYLTWLADGRRDPNANIGYVFLFFYGLERRVLIDAANDETVKDEIPAIVAEIERMRLIYDNNSFLRYSSDLLDFLDAGEVTARLYLKSPPPATASRGMSLRMRVGLGQCAVDRRPVSAEWAVAWARSEANIHLPGVAKRCPDQFDAQFRRIYQKTFGEGLRLAVNRTKLKIGYRAASGGLLTQSFTSNISELPDVTTVVTPVTKLQGVVDETAAGLEAYSRFIGRHADQAASLEATLLLPPALWSAAVKEAVEVLDKRVGSGMVVIKLGELVTAFGGTGTVTRETLKGLFQILRVQNVGAEPDVLAGAKTPKSDESVVLFRAAADDSPSNGQGDSGYAALAVMLDLAITLANADGQISGREVQFLNRQVDAWSHAGASAQKRLRARLRLGIVYPPTLASLKSRIEPLPVNARMALAKLLSALALADGKLRPAAVKHLEKIYALLEIEAGLLYRQLHVASAAAEVKAPPIADVQRPELQKPAVGVSPAVPPPVNAPPAAGAAARVEPAGTPSVKVPLPAIEAGGFKLDAARIAALQVESERVTALLSKVFDEQEPTPDMVAKAPAVDADVPETKEHTPRLLGLDAEHSAFLRILLTRPSWSRAELGDIAADMELMLDGALERVNEAALDVFENRIAEGDDPIEIAQDLMENVSA